MLSRFTNVLGIVFFSVVACEGPMAVFISDGFLLIQDLGRDLVSERETEAYLVIIGSL